VGNPADSSAPAHRGPGGSAPVINISIPWMLETVAAIDALATFAPQEKYGDVFAAALSGRAKLEILFGQSVYAPYLRASRERGNVLYAALGNLVNDEKHEWDAEIKGQAFSIQNAAKEFKLVFRSEISTLPVYLVEPKDNYDVALLIERGAGLFPPTMLAKAPETAFDAGEAGKALAFRLSTACGFHTFRVLESVLKRYWDSATGGDTRPEPATIGKIAADLENKKKGDLKVTESLKQFAKLHRNPCTHSDVALTEEEAIGTLGIARSIIAAMLKALPDVPPPTTVASSAAQS
jgi:hypothetical protein